MNNRITYLKAEFELNPTDPFNAYGLAMEYLSTNPSEALTWLEWLLANIPDYLPTYYQAASLYQDFDDAPNAKMCYDKGIALANAQNNPKILSELERAYYNFQLEN
jgi:tetratricopeptide (TPR) repeat protein